MDPTVKQAIAHYLAEVLLLQKGSEQVHNVADEHRGVQQMHLEQRTVNVHVAFRTLQYLSL
jgi:hypothetical protein